MNWTSIPAAALIFSAVPALADNSQFARGSGVEPGALTTVEMIQLRRDVEEDNRDGAARRVKHAKQKGTVAVTRSSQ